LEALNNPPSQSVQVSNFSQQPWPLSSSSSIYIFGLYDLIIL
jgi:hypothetical protein